MFLLWRNCSLLQVAMRHALWKTRPHTRQWMVVHTLTREVAAGGALWIQGQSVLPSEFQDSQGCTGFTEKPCLGGGVDLTVWSHLCTQYKEVKYKESFDINLRWEFFKKDPCLGTRTTMTPTVLLTSSSGRQKARRLREGWNEWGEGKAAMRKQSLLQQDAGSWIAAFSSIPSMATFSSVSSYQRWMESCWAKTMEKNHFLDFKNLVADAKSSMLGWGYNSVQGLLLSRHKSLGLILWTEKSKKWVER